MDFVLDWLDPTVLDHMYQRYFPPSFQQRDWWVRQYVSIYLIWWLGGCLMYYSCSGLSYLIMFDRSARKHKKFLPNQELQEIAVAMKSIPIMAIPSAFIFLGEVRNYSLLYNELATDERSVLYILFSIVLYLFFTDTLIYWIHRWLHHPLLYAPIHKLHHKWVISTPFASHAFHPVDGFLQSVPYHIFVFLFPLNKIVYLGLFIFVNIWTISIHDGSGFYAGTIINGADHHTIHHRQFNFNFGQYFTLWDRLCGTHKLPVGAELEKVVPSEKIKASE
jgi:lathosterol oxidase